MRIALINTSKKSKLYPVSLMKIASYLKNKNIEVKLFTNELPEKDEFDEIWITTLFTFEIPHASGIIREAANRASKVKVGGVASSLLPGYFEKENIDLHVGLWPDVEDFSPDYSILDEDPVYSISHITRGCSNKCGFCMVPKLEPVYHKRKNWQNDICQGTKKILFYDNNWLVQEPDEMRKDVKDILRIVKEYGIKEIDFNQGMDCRILTDEKADILAQLPINPVRFAFDGMHEDGHWQGAIEKMAKRGKRDFQSYVLYNYKDTPEDFYYRIKEHPRLSALLDIDCKSFPMRYQPILEIDKQRGFVGKHWTLKDKIGVHTIIASHSVTGQISCHGGREGFSEIEEFEFWFGKNSEEFVKLINYPKLRTLMKKRKAWLREKRMMKQG